MLAYFEYFIVTDKKQTIFVTEIVKIVGIENFIGFPRERCKSLARMSFREDIIKPIFC